MNQNYSLTFEQARDYGDIDKITDVSLQSFFDILLIYFTDLIKPEKRIILFETIKDNKRVYIDVMENGKYDILYRDNQMTITYSSKNVNKLVYDKLTIDFLNKVSNEFIEQMFTDIHKIVINSFNNSMISVFLANSQPQWVFDEMQKKISYDSLEVSDKTKKIITKDLDRFITRKEYYLKNDIVHKRVYLIKNLQISSKKFMLGLCTKYNKSLSIMALDDFINIYGKIASLRDNTMVLINLEKKMELDIDVKNELMLNVGDFLDEIKIANTSTHTLGEVIIFIFCGKDPQKTILENNRVDKIISAERLNNSQKRKLYEKLMPNQSKHIDQFFYKIKKMKVDDDILKGFFIEYEDSESILDHIDDLKRMCDNNIKNSLSMYS